MTNNFEEVGIRAVVKDLGQFLHGTGQMQTGIDSVGKAATNADPHFNKLGGTISQVGKIAAGVFAADVVTRGIGALTGVVTSSVKAASDLGESINAVTQIFDEAADTVLDWGKANANAFGLSQREFNQMATPIGAMIKNFGFSADQTADYTINLTKRAADMASVFNTDVGTALTAIQAALRGEIDPIEKFGVSMNAAAVDAEALAMTGKTVTKELTAQEKAAARLSLIFKMTADTEGDFANTSDGLANAQRIARARSEEFSATLGQKLMPIMIAVTRAKANLTGQLTKYLLPAIDAAIKLFSQFGNYLKAVAQDGDVLNDFLTHIPEPLRGVAQAIAKVVLIGQDLVRFFVGLQDEAAQLGKALLDLYLRYLSGVWKGFSDVLSITADVVEAIINVADVFVDLGRKLGLFEDPVGNTTKGLEDFGLAAEVAGRAVGIFLGYLVVRELISFGVELAKVAYTLATWPFRAAQTILDNIETLRLRAMFAGDAMRDFAKHLKETYDQLTALASKAWAIVQNTVRTGADLITDIAKDVYQTIHQRVERTGDEPAIAPEAEVTIDAAKLQTQGKNMADKFAAGFAGAIGGALVGAISVPVGIAIVAALGIAVIAGLAYYFRDPIADWIKSHPLEVANIVAFIFPPAFVPVMMANLVKLFTSIDWSALGKRIAELLVQGLGFGLTAAVLALVVVPALIYLAFREGFVPLGAKFVELGKDLINLIVDGVVAGFEAFRDFQGMLNTFLTQTLPEAIGGAAEDVGRFILDQLIIGVTKAFEREKRGFERIITGFLTFDPDLVLGGLNDLFLGVPKIALDSFGKIPGIVSDAISEIPGIVSFVFTKLPGIIGQVAAGLPGLFALVVPMIIDLIDELPALVGGILRDLLGEIGINLDGIGRAIEEGWRWFTEQFSIGAQRVFQIVDEAFGVSIPEVFNDLLAIVESVFNAIINAIVGAFTGATGAALDLVTGVYNTITGIFEDLMNWINDLFWNRIPNSIWGAIQGVTRAAWQLATDVWNTISNILWSLPEDLARAGGAAVQRLWEGFSSFDLYNSIRNFVRDNIPEAIRNLLGIGSPSRVMWDIGRNIIEGLMGGIREKLPNLAAEAAARIFGVFWNVASGVTGAVTNAVGQTLDAAGNVIGGIAGAIGGIFSGGGGGGGSAGAAISASVERWRALVAQYFPAGEVENALRVMQAESGGNSGAVGVNRNGSRDVGLFQINDIHGLDMATRLDPYANVRFAAELFRRSGWRPWSVAPGLGLAAGTANWQGGMAMLGEHGPELAVLPSGSGVLTAQETRTMLKGLWAVSNALRGLNVNQGGAGNDTFITFNVAELNATDRQQAEARGSDLGFALVANARSRGFQI